MISFHFDVDEVNNFDDACNANADLFKTLFHGVLKEMFTLLHLLLKVCFINYHTKALLDKLS